MIKYLDLSTTPIRTPFSIPGDSRTRTFVLAVGICVASVAVGFVAVRGPLIAWDDVYRLEHARYWLSLFSKEKIARGTAVHYGPLWDVITFLAHKHLFGSFSYYRVLHALNFALLPLSLAALYFSLKSAGVSRTTRIAAVVLFASCTRFVGHALVNPKDFPAAAAFLLSSVWLWLFFRSRDRIDTFTTGNMFLLGGISLLPFVIRPPLALHACIAAVVLSGICLASPGKTMRQKLLPIGTYLLVCANILVIAFPLHFSPYQKHLNPAQIVTTFTHYAPQKSEYTGSAWQYYLSGMLNLGHPAVVVTIMLLCLLSLRARSPKLHLFLGRKISMSLHCWLWLIFLVTFAIICLLRPILYNQQRQLLFAYALLPVLASFSIGAMRPKARFAILSIAAIFGTHTTATWNSYSYAYGNTLASVTGLTPYNSLDYWNICTLPALEALKKSDLPDGTPIFIQNQGTVGWSLSVAGKNNPYGRFSAQRLDYEAVRQTMGLKAIIANNFDSPEVIALRIGGTETMTEYYSDKMANGIYACGAFVIRPTNQASS